MGLVGVISYTYLDIIFTLMIFSNAFVNFGEICHLNGYNIVMVRMGVVLLCYQENLQPLQTVGYVW